MSFFLVVLTDKPHTKRDGIDTMVVSAEDEADARAMCKAQYTGFASDAAWDAATATLLADVAAADANALVDWRFQVSILDAVPPIAVEVVGDATDDTLDEIGAALAVALNADAQIANATYTAGTQTLVAAGLADALGDLVLTVNVFPPLVQTYGKGQDSQDENIPGFVASITDQGIQLADLVVVFAADTFIVPVVLDQSQSVSI